MSQKILLLNPFPNLQKGLKNKIGRVNDIVFNSFVIITLGAFGIAEAGKIFGKKETEE